VLIPIAGNWHQAAVYPLFFKYARCLHPLWPTHRHPERRFPDRRAGLNGTPVHPAQSRDLVQADDGIAPHCFAIAVRRNG